MPGTQRSFKEKLYCHSLILSCLCRGKQTFWLLCFFLPLLPLLLSPKHSCILFLVPTNFYSFCLSWFLWTSPTFSSCLVLLYCDWVFLCSQADLKLRAPLSAFQVLQSQCSPTPCRLSCFLYLLSLAQPPWCLWRGLPHSGILCPAGALSPCTISSVLPALLPAQLFAETRPLPLSSVDRAFRITSDPFLNYSSPKHILNLVTYSESRHGRYTFPFFFLPLCKIDHLVGIRIWRWNNFS